MGQAPADPQLAGVVEDADVAGAVPAPGMRRRLLGVPEPVVEGLAVWRRHQDLTHDAGRVGRLADSDTEVVECADRAPSPRERAGRPGPRRLVDAPTHGVDASSAREMSATGSISVMP